MTLFTRLRTTARNLSSGDAIDRDLDEELAAYVDQKLRAAQDAAPASDTLGLAILTALNLADEIFRSRQQKSSGHSELNERALQLEQLVDEALSQVSE